MVANSARWHCCEGARVLRGAIVSHPAARALLCLRTPPHVAARHETCAPRPRPLLIDALYPHSRTYTSSVQSYRFLVGWLPVVVAACTDSHQPIECVRRRWFLVHRAGGGSARSAAVAVCEFGGGGGGGSAQKADHGACALTRGSSGGRTRWTNSSLPDSAPLTDSWPATSVQAGSPDAFACFVQLVHRIILYM